MILAEDDESLTAYVSTVGGTAYVVAFFDNTVVYVNGKFQGVLSAGERLSLTVNAGDIISANKPIMVHSSSERHVPITWKDTKFVIPFYRNDPQTIYIYAPDGDATVNIYVGTSTTPTTTVTVAKGTATKVQINVTPPKTVILESDSPILVAVSSNNETYDFRFIHPPARDLILIPSSQFYVSALEDNTTIIWYQGNNSGTYTLNRGEIVSHSALGISTGNQYNATPVRVIADKPIMISSFADGDGTDATCGLPVNKLGTYYVLPVAAQWLSIAVPFNETRIRIYYAGKLKYETTVSNTYSNNTPALLYLSPSDIDSSWTSIPYGTVIESDKPIMIIFDCAEAWLDDETVLLGINHRKWRIHQNPVLTLTTDLVPPQDNALDIGSEILRWRNGHFAGSLFVDGDVYGVRVPIIWDDTLVSAGTSETEVKYARFAKHSTYEPISRLIVLASLWTTSGTAYLKVYINDEASPRLTLSTTSTGETLVAGEVDISDLGDGIHTIHVKIYSDSGTAYNKLLEVWGVRR